jgi:hypothetical protein
VVVAVLLFKVGLFGQRVQALAARKSCVVVSLLADDMDRDVL